MQTFAFKGLENVALMNSAEFVENELSLPSFQVDLGVGCPVSLMSNEALSDLVEPAVSSGVDPVSFEVASSLLSLKTGFTPVANDTNIQEGGCASLVCAESKETVPQADPRKLVYSSPLVQQHARANVPVYVNKENLVPAVAAPTVHRRFTYPSPPPPVFVPKIKEETTSPSYDTYGTHTASFSIQQTSSIKFRGTTLKSPRQNHRSVMDAIHPNNDSPMKAMHMHKNFQMCTTMSMPINTSPIVTNSHFRGSNLFSPL